MKFKKILAVLLALIVVFASMPAIVSSAAAANSTVETAKVVSPTSSGTHYFNNVSYNDHDLWFKVKLSDNGVLKFSCTKMADVTGDVDTIYFYLYKSIDTSTPIWQDNSYYYEDSYGDYEFTLPLKSGTYYLRMQTNLYDESREIDYSFKFTKSSTYEVEPNNGANVANTLTKNKTTNAYTGADEDFFRIKLDKNTPIRLRIGNYAELEEASVYIQITHADGKSEYFYSGDSLKGSGYYYQDFYFKKGTTIIRVSSERPEIKYYIHPSTKISYKAPTITGVEKESYSTEVSWKVMDYVDGYEIWRKVGTGSYKLLKDANSSWYDGISMYDIDAKKSYQIRMRCYKKFGDKKYYSDWSKVVYLIPTPTNIKLSATTFVYNGKTKTPSITIKDVNGRKLVKNTDYTVKYSSGRKSIGSYKATITFKGKYSGKATKTFKIVPKGTSVSKTSSTSKGKIKVTWKKQKTQTTGYQIQVSTSSKFKSAKTTTVKKNSTVSTTIKSLKSKKTYYVRVRTYKTVRGEKFYSSWSKAVKRKVK